MIALVSGASSGLGREFAEQIDEKYDEIRLLARRRERLEDLARKLKTPSKIFPIDLTKSSDLEKFEGALKKEEPKIGLLVNAAGMGVNDYFAESGKEAFEKTLDLNCKGLTSLCKMCLPYMKKGSLIINIASSSAFLPQPKFAVYSASKAYVLSFSRALNREVREKGIRVSALCPNPVATEFQKNSKNKPAKIKKIGFENKEKLVKKALEKCPKKDVVITHRAARTMLVLSKIFPASFIMRIERKMGLY